MTDFVFRHVKDVNRARLPLRVPLRMGSANVSGGVFDQGSDSGGCWTELALNLPEAGPQLERVIPSIPNKGKRQDLADEPLAPWSSLIDRCV